MKYETKLSILWVPVILGVIPCLFGYAFINMPWFRYAVYSILALLPVSAIIVMIICSPTGRSKNDQK